MQSSRESSLWRSLAVAFGDGLAFGVGMKLTQAAGRQLIQPTATPVRQEPGPLTERVEQIEQNLKRMERAPAASPGAAPAPGSGSAADQKVLETIINALEARLAEHAGQVERRLADLDARLAIELRSLDQQDEGLGKRITDEIHTLQQQVVALNRQFGEAVARIVAEQVGSQVEARTAALEQTMSRRIAIAAEAAVAPYLASLRREQQESVNSKIAEQVAEQVAGRSAAIEQQLREEVARRDAEIAELRRRVADSESNVLEVILAIGEVCRQAAGKIGSPSPAPQSGGAPSPAPAGEPGPVSGGSGPAVRAETTMTPRVPEPPAREEGRSEVVPGFTQAQKGGLWRVPLVSSIIVATGWLTLGHFLLVR